MVTLTMWKRTQALTRPDLQQALSEDPYEIALLEPADIEGPARRGRLESAALLAGRLIFGSYFVYSSIAHYQDVASLSAHARGKGVPAPKAAVLGSGALIALGGLSVLLGARPKAGAGLIAAFLLGVTPVIHNFWAQEEAQAKRQEKVNFLKNVGLFGGAALAAAVPEPWPLSLGNRKRESDV